MGHASGGGSAVAGAVGKSGRAARAAGSPGRPGRPRGANGGVLRHELVRRVAERSGLARAEAQALVDALIVEVWRGLRNEGRVTLKGLGTFTARPSCVHRLRGCIGPGTGVVVVADPPPRVKFVASRLERERLRGAEGVRP